MITAEKLIEEVEAEHFRTQEDTGANECAMTVWNCVRRKLGREPLIKSSLPAYCLTHKVYHIIKPDYGCVKK